MDFYHMEEMIAELKRIDDIIPSIIQELAD